MNGLGWSSNDDPIVVAGMENAPLITKVFAENRFEFDVDQMESGTVNVAG